VTSVFVEKPPAEVWVLHKDGDCYAARGLNGDEKTMGSIGIAEYMAAQNGKYLVAFKCRHCFPETKVDREIRWPPRYLWNLIKHGKFIPKKQDAPVGDEGTRE